MRRLARHAFTILSAISLLLCVAVCVLWIGSYWWTATINRYSRDYDGDALLTLQASAARGRVVISRRYWARGGDAKVEYAVSYAWPEPDPDRRIAGFGWTSYQTPPDMVDSCEQALSVPCWALAVLTACGGFPASRCFRNSTPVGHCATCGYDLRATPDRCPECGGARGAPVGLNTPRAS